MIKTREKLRCEFNVRAIVRSVLWFCLVLVFMSFILKFCHGSCLCHASLSLMSSCYWFPCSMCHVLISCHVHCVMVPLVVLVMCLVFHWFVHVM